MAHFGFARGDSIRGRFDPVVDSVPHDMQKWLTEPVKDRPVEFEFGPDDLDFDAFAELLGHLPRGAWEILRHANERSGPEFKDSALQLRHASIDSVETVGHLRILRITRHTRTKLT
jgi:hypothetical protein